MACVVYVCVLNDTTRRQENVYRIWQVNNVSWKTYDAVFPFPGIPLTSRWTLVYSADGDAVEQAPPHSRLKKTKREAKVDVLVPAATEEKKKK